MRNNSFDDDSPDFITNTQCMDDFGEYSPDRPKKTNLEFRKMFKAIQEEGNRKGLCPAYCILMINRNFGYIGWGKIPYGRWNDMVDFIRNNHVRANHIIWPDEFDVDGNFIKQSLIAGMGKL